MFRASLPDAINSLGAMGGAQGAYGAGPKPAGEQTPNDATQMNTIFASLDGDKNTTVTKTEAQPQISQGFSFKAMAPGKANVFMKFTQLTGYSDVTQYAKSLYAAASNNFQNISSGSKEVAQGETAQAQQELDNSVQNEINAQIKNLNTDVQNKYIDALMQATQTAAQEEKEILATIQQGEQPNQEASAIEDNLQNISSLPVTPSTNLGIHNKPTNHDGTSLYGMGAQSKSGNTSWGGKLTSTHGMYAYAQKGNTTLWTNIDLQGGYRNTAEGGRIDKPYVEIGWRTNF